MKDQVKVPVIVLAVVAIVGALFFFGSKAMSVGDLDQGQVKYTPGKPPWEDPLQKGNNNGRVPTGDPAAAPPGGGPPGLAAPTRG
ncbi:hypothetical protein EON82_02335 [bacterium]|nr:MAG: hypothetical protein EON82_02335 [bacterium]